MIRLLGAVLASLMFACSSSSELTSASPVTLVPEVRIGSETKGPEYQFTALDFIAVHGDNVYVGQRSTKDIRVFGNDGVFRRTIGRQGQGPGEFDSIWSIGVAGDSVWLIDVNLRRLTFFAPDGTLAGTIPFEPVPMNLGQGVLFLPYPDVLMPEGDFLGFGRGAAASVAEGDITSNPLLHMTAQGHTADTLGWVSVKNDALILRSARSRSYRTQPFTDTPITVYAAAARRAYVIERWSATGETAPTVKVTALGANGDTAWVRQLSYAAARHDPAKIDSVRAAYVRVLGPRYGKDEIHRALYMPEFRTPVTSAIAADNGTLWIRWDDVTKPASYAVLSASGDVMSSVSAASRIKLKWVSDSTAWGEELDENDVPTLVRYRITRTP